MKTEILSIQFYSEKVESLPEFSSLKQLEAAINKKIANALKNEVATTVKKVMREKVYDEVYSVYNPKVYDRQMDDGGLSDIDNMESNMINDNTLTVENIRHDGNRNVAQIVESGEGYLYDFEYNGVARPFTEATREELKNTNEHIYSLFKGLKRQGLDVEK